MPRRLVQLGLIGSLGVLVAMTACGGDDDEGTGATGGVTGAGGSSPTGGSSSSGSGGGMCPNLAGMWTVRMHCQAVLVGSAITVTQTGCMFRDTTTGISGTVQANGMFTASGNVPIAGPATCTGTATATMITQNCTIGGAPCAVTLDRPAP